MASVVPFEDWQHEHMLKDKPPASYLDEEVKAHASAFSSVHVANQPRFDSFLRRLSACVVPKKPGGRSIDVWKVAVTC